MNGRPRLLSIQPFAPPVTGMAVVAGAVTDLLEERADVRRLSVAAPGLHRSGHYHRVRLWRNLCATAVIARERRRTQILYLSANAGAGMLYTLAQVLIARALRYRIHLQHHCYNYVARRSRLMAAVVAALGRRNVHVVVCRRMGVEFQEVYPRARTTAVSVAFAVEDPAETRVPRPASARPALRMGMLGNLTAEKGLGRALDVAEVAAAGGVKTELLLAGPVPEPEDRAMLARRISELGDDKVRHVGPLYGADRDRFLVDLDVLLFPSLYVNESFGLVAWEAMVRGVPVVAYRAGCLTAEAVAGGGHVLEPGEDFAAAVLPLLERWSADRGALDRTGRTASAVARRRIARGRDELTALADAIVLGEGAR